jgi:tetratricopeptide (TPR) repeat protein
MCTLRHTCVVIVSMLCCLAGGLSTPWAQSMPADQTIAFYQRALQRNSFDVRTYCGLGDAYSRKARESGDVTYFHLAEQALRQALQLRPQYSEALRHLAFVLYARHDFAGAAQEATKAIELDPTDGHAYGVLGDAHLEVGQYVQAQEALQRMLDLQRDLYAYSRLSGLKSLRGDTAGAIEDLKRAIEVGQMEGRLPEHIAWAQWQLGNEYFALGNLREAEGQYRAALATYPDYYRALAGLAQIQAAQQHYQEAIDLYQQALAIVPMPDYAAALGDVYTQLGQPEEARKQYALVEYIGYLNTLNKVLYNRELAVFYADHNTKLAEALELAKKELEVRQDIYAYDLLAWILYKNGQPQEALAAITEALKLGTQDAKLFFHAGLIYHQLGDIAKAKLSLQRALATNPYFHIVHADVAKRTLEGLGERFGQAE